MTAENQRTEARPLSASDWLGTIGFVGPAALLVLITLVLPDKPSLHQGAVPGDTLFVPTALVSLAYLVLFVTSMALLARKHRDRTVLVLIVCFGWVISWPLTPFAVHAVNATAVRDVRQVDATVVSTRYDGGSNSSRAPRAAYLQTVPGSEKGLTGNYAVTNQEFELFREKPGLHVRLTVGTGALGNRVLLSKQIYDPAQPGTAVEPRTPPHYGGGGGVVPAALIFGALLMAVFDLPARLARSAGPWLRKLLRRPPPGTPPPDQEQGRA